MKRQYFTPFLPGDNEEEISRVNGTPEVISSFISTGDSMLLDGQSITSQKKENIINETNMKIGHGNPLDEKDEAMIIESQSKQRSANAKPIILKIEIPFRWYMTEKGSPYIVINFLIDKNTKINMIEKVIRYYILQQSYENQAFALIKRFRYESAKCVFNTKKQGYNDNDKILDVILEKMPKRIRLNSSTINGYQASLRVKEEYITHLARYVDEMQENNGAFRLEENELKDKVDEKSNQLQKNHKNAQNYLFGQLPKLETKTETDKLLNDIYREKRFKVMNNNELELESLCFYKKHLKKCWNKLSNQEFETKFDEKYSKLKTTINDIYNHEIHKEMGYPLCKAFIFGLYLYTSDETNVYKTLKNVIIRAHNEYQLIANGKMNEISSNLKRELNDIAILDYLIYYGITILDRFRDSKKNRKFDKHRDYQLYSGASNTIYQNNSEKWVEFIVPTSFSMDINVAKGFCQSNNSNDERFDKGEQSSENEPKTLIVLNDLDKIVCADVSWISIHDNEYEVLVRRCCGINVNQTDQSVETMYNVVSLG